MAALATAAAPAQRVDACAWKSEAAPRHWAPVPALRDSDNPAAFLQEMRRLRLQIASLEKDKNTYLFSKKNERAEYNSFEELDLKMANNRKTEQMKIQQQLAKIHHNVKRFQGQLKDVKPTPEFIEKLREIMEEVEDSINVFKEAQRQIYENLLKEEKVATQEVLAVEKKIEIWARNPTVISKTALAKGSSIKPGNVLVEIADFEKFLQQTGHQGGWDDFDHKNFLKVWTKHKGKPSFIEEALQYLVGRTREDIIQHEQWYQEFLFLEKRRKEAIQRWKTEKQQEKEKLMRLQAQNGAELDAEQQAKEEAKRLRAEKERRERAIKLQLWKKEKELEFAQEKEKQMKEEAERIKREKKESLRRLKVKKVLEDYTKQKKEEEEFLQLETQMREQAEKEEKQWLVAKEISRFQERDFNKLEFKLLEKRMQKEMEDEREKRFSKLKEKVEAQIQRDPSRLFKLTKGWEEHTKNIGKCDGGPVLYLPHRAVPSWRKGI
ncbi:coiled-coil domain-containing protein 112-like isoform X1 [Mobula birostris]|uniref:coiled-coil domain-containing protein 112-like isoform X1 n=2 Tax=Mobula birostris TaxID=1983395 RepID=UPI003B27C4B2